MQNSSFLTFVVLPCFTYRLTQLHTPSFLKLLNVKRSELHSRQGERQGEASPISLEFFKLRILFSFSIITHNYLMTKIHHALSCSVWQMKTLLPIEKKSLICGVGMEKRRKVSLKRYYCFQHCCVFADLRMGCENTGGRGVKYWSLMRDGWTLVVRKSWVFLWVTLTGEKGVKLAPFQRETDMQ